MKGYWKETQQVHRREFIKLQLIIFIFLIVFSSFAAAKSMLNQELLKSVAELQTDGHSATGFFVVIKPYVNENVYLVTCKHVLEGQKLLNVRMNLKQKGIKTITLPLSLLDTTGRPVWTPHPDPTVDVAVVPAMSFLPHIEGLMDFIYIQEDLFGTFDRLTSGDVEPGQEVFFIGFPLSQRETEQNLPVVRIGTIATLPNTLEGLRKGYLIDGQIYPGNSGGPVILKPSVWIHPESKLTIQGPSQLLIGLVTSYVSYQERAISEQTKHVRVVFEENSGLGNVLPIEVIKETIVEAKKNKKSD